MMMKRLVKEATNGFSSSGEQSSRTKKKPLPTTGRSRRGSASESDSGNQRIKAKGGNKRAGARDSETKDDKLRKRDDETPTEEDDASARRTQKKKKPIDAERRKKASRRKREPLLDYKIIETVHSAMHGKKKKRARQELLDLFASYDVDDTGCVDADKFTKCIAKVGIKLTRRDDIDALLRCFTKSSSSATKDEDEEEDQAGSDTKSKSKRVQVDYVSFIDFACNVRDSESLSAIAEKLRTTIKVYDDKHDRATTVPYNMVTDLKRLDKSKRGWIASDRFADFLADHERPTFKVTAKEIAILTERFEYEYGKGELGLDYDQFARWLQPALHLNNKELHARVKRLVGAAQEVGGWELNEVFEAMDDNGDGHVSSKELKKALLDMGLPLTDAQIQCLVDEYDVNGDAIIEYEEFVSLFQAPKSKKTKTKQMNNRESGSGSDTDATRKRKSIAKANVRNTFSWAIHKAFARKHAAQGKPNQSDDDDERSSKTKTKQAKKKLKSKRVESSSEDEKDEEVSEDGATKRRKLKKGKRGAKRSSESAETEADRSRAKNKKKETKRHKSSSDELESSSVSESGRTKSKLKASRLSPQKSKSKTKAKKKNVSSTESEDDRKKSSSGRRKSDKSQSKSKTRAKHDDHSGDDDDDDDDDHASKPQMRKKRMKSKADAEETSDAPKRQHRSQSAVSNRSRRKESTTTRSRSRQRRDSSARPTSPRRRQSVERSRSRGATTRHGAASNQRRRRRSMRRRPRDDDADDDGGTGDARSVSSSDGSMSGLDRNQVRDLQRQPRKKRPSKPFKADGGSDDDFDDEQSGSSGDDQQQNQGSPSDQEYAKHLTKSLRRAFDFFDLDHNAMIEKKELSHVLRALGHEFSSKELDREMNKMDLDQNGALDFHEFVRFVKKQLEKKAFLLSNHREMEIRRSFQSLDTDKNGALDEKEFEYLIYKVLHVELSVEEQDALLDFVDTNGDGVINEEEFMAFMKAMESFHTKGALTTKKQQRGMLDTLDGVSKQACSAMKKLIRGAPMDLDTNLLVFFGIPSNFRPALTSSAGCRTLHENSMEHALSFPCPETMVAMAQDPVRVGVKKEITGVLDLVRAPDANAVENEEMMVLLRQAESWQAHAIVSLKKATGVPKPFDTREEDVVKRCVHVCLYQEQDEVTNKKRRKQEKTTTRQQSRAGSEGVIIGNVHEIPVYWNPQEEDVWSFSKKATKEDKYKFLVRTNNVNDRLFLLVEFIVHLRMTTTDYDKKKNRKGKNKKKKYKHRMARGDDANQVREMTACWCKVPIRTLLAKRLEVYRCPQKLWGGTVQSPIDIEQDEVLRRRKGWRAITNAFTKPAPPAMGIKSAPVESYPEDIQGFVRKMPPLIIAPFVSLPIVAEYMTTMQSSLWLKPHNTSAMLCEPVLTLLPRIIDDHEALSVFRRVFDTEMSKLKSPEERQKTFQDLVLRMWPSFLELLGKIPSSLVQDASASASVRRLSVLSPAGVPKPASGTTNDPLPDQQARSNLLQCTAQGKLRLRDIPVAAAPFHVREVAFERLI